MGPISEGLMACISACKLSLLVLLVFPVGYLGIGVRALCESHIGGFGGLRGPLAFTPTLIYM